MISAKLVDSGSVVLFCLIGVCSQFHNYLPLEKGVAFHLNKLPFIQGCFVPSLIEIGPVGLENKIFKFRKCFFAIL